MEQKHAHKNNTSVYEHGVDIAGRRIFMNASLDEDCGAVDTANADHISKSLHILTSSKELAKKPITIVINSPGGDISDFFCFLQNKKGGCAHATAPFYFFAFSLLLFSYSISGFTSSTHIGMKTDFPRSRSTKKNACRGGSGEAPISIAKSLYPIRDPLQTHLSVDMSWW
jgi:hypothetical protein